MKRRMVFAFTDKDGFTWLGDCPRWAAKARKTGRYVESRVAVYGKGQWRCGCQDGLSC